MDELIKGEIYSKEGLSRKIKSIREYFDERDEKTQLKGFGTKEGRHGEGIYRHYKIDKDSNSIWLFVTEIKGEEVEQYEDELIGDILEWQGQKGQSSFNEEVINHQRDNREIHLFYRRRRDEYIDNAFKYEGEFVLLTIRAKNEDNYKLVKAIFVRKESKSEYIEKEDKLDQEKLNDEAKAIRYRENARRKYRTGQAEMRKRLLEAYSNKCAVTSCDVPGALEAAHIFDATSGRESMKTQNGLLLRRDIHRLFDIGFISLDNDYRLLLSKKLENGYYEEYNGKKINLPENVELYPDVTELEKHRKNKFRI